jgi:hypothetical protein
MKESTMNNTYTDRTEELAAFKAAKADYQSAIRALVSRQRAARAARDRARLASVAADVAAETSRVALATLEAARVAWRDAHLR